MDEREYRHARGNAEAAVNMLRKALESMALPPEKLQRVQDQLKLAEARLAELEANKPAQAEG